MTAVLDKMQGQRNSPACANTGATATVGGNPMSQDQGIPYGYCQCGCGQKTTIAKHNSPRDSMVRGEPMRFMRGHHKRKFSPSNPAGVYRVEDRGYDTPCWVVMTTYPKGYGKISHNGKKAQAHRVFYEKHVGKVPEGMQLDHLCRVRACCNPEHLEIVTPQENTRRGISTRLNEAQVAEIKARIPHERMTALADEFGVGRSTIRSIAYGKSWKDVKARV